MTCVLAAVLCAGSILGSLWLRFSPSGLGFRGSDSYSNIAVHILSHGGFETAFRPPLYPLFLAGMMRLFGENWEIGAVVCQALLGSVLALLVMRCATKLSGSAGAGVFALLLFFSNILFQFEVTAKRETTLFTLFLMWFFYAAFFVERRGRRYAFLATSAAGAFLLRPNALALFPVAFVLFLSDRRAHQAALKDLLFPAALFVLLVLPWQLFVYRVTGTFPLTTSTNSGQTLWKGNNPDLLAVWPKADIDLLEPEMSRRIGGKDITSADGDAELRAQAKAYMKEHVSETITHGLIKMLVFYSPVPIPMGDGEVVVENGAASVSQFRCRNPIILLVSTVQSCVVLAGWILFVVSARSRTPRHRTAALSSIVLTLFLSAIHILTYPESRYRWPLDILWTVLAADYLWFRWSRMRQPSAACSENAGLR